jgi:hypothetical protein
VSRLNRREFLLASFPFFWRKQPFVTLCDIRFQVLRNDDSPHRYLLIHGNEKTAREVLAEHMRNTKGIAWLVTGQERYVQLEGGKLDPNRMFSREGAEKNLRSLNPDWSPEQLEKALRKLDRCRPKLLSRLLPPPDGRLVALHNNSEGYSVNDEVASSDEVSLKDAGHPHEFFLATDASDFAILGTSPFNVVLQRKAPKEDDGSLSRLAARRGVRYMNLEVALGERAKQVEMLGWLEAHLR